MKTVTADFKTKANLSQGTTPVILSKLFYGDATPKSISSSTDPADPAPIVVTVTAHGFANGDSIWITGHSTNTKANGCWIIANVTTNTFELKGSSGNGVGGATGTAVRCIFASTRKVTVEKLDSPIATDIYKSYVESFGEISFAVSEAPGLGQQSSCDIILKRKIFAETGGGTENVVENLLTQKSKGKQVLLWQFFDDGVTPVLDDSDKLPLGIFIIDDVFEIEGARIQVHCVSPELKIELETPKLKFNKTDFPNLLESNLNLARPILLGSFEYPFREAVLPNMPEREYLFCNRPFQPLMPAYLTDIYDFKFLVHEATDALDISNAWELQFFEWLSEWNILAFCNRLNIENESFAISNSSGQTIVDMNALFNVTDTGRERYVRIMPSEAP